MTLTFRPRGNGHGGKLHDDLGAAEPAARSHRAPPGQEPAQKQDQGRQEGVHLEPRRSHLPGGALTHDRTPLPPSRMVRAMVKVRGKLRRVSILRHWGRVTAGRSLCSVHQRPRVHLLRTTSATRQFCGFRQTLFRLTCLADRREEEKGQPTERTVPPQWTVRCRAPC